MQNLSEKINLSHNELLGQHLLTNMDIDAGETILEECPLFVAPHWDCGKMKCAQCMQESYVMCTKCQIFPLCMDCKTHDAYECQYFCNDGAGAKVSKNMLVTNYNICAALKLLLLIENPVTSSKCKSLIDSNIHIDDYRDSEMWQEHEEQVIVPLLQSGLTDTFNQIKVDANLLHKLCINIDKHAFEVIARDGDTLKGIYVCSASLPHHCVPNIVVSLDEDFRMKLYAAVPIKAGNIIYNSYSNPLMGTSQRQHQLRMNRHLECACTRCLDPTELGTHMSSMKCKQCADGYAICDVLQNAGNWICIKCNAIILATDVHKLLAELGEAMVCANGDLKVYEKLLTKYMPNFHPNHFLILDIKQNIATILRALLVMNSMHDPGKKLLKRRVQLCQELLPITRAVLPGISKLYATALFEYLLSFLELSNLEFRTNDINQEAYSRKLELAKSVAEKALSLLIYEPANSPEGYLAQRIIMEQQSIDDELKKINAK